MTDRGVAYAIAALVVASVLAILLFAGVADAQARVGGGSATRVSFGERPPPAAQTIGQIDERFPGAVRPAVLAQRQVGFAFREAAGYLLALIGVAGALLFAHGAVVAGYRASLGGWRVQLRALALGAALLAVIMSALFLMFVTLLGAFGGPAQELGAGGQPVLVQRVSAAAGPFLQVGVTAIAVAIVLIGLVVIVGIAAASWRLGDRIFALRPLARIGQAAPPTLVAITGISLIYLATQIPVAGRVVELAALAYALGIVASARLSPASSTPPARM